MGTLTLYPLSNYAVKSKEAQSEEDTTVSSRLHRLEAEYATQGIRNTVEGVLLVHEHGYPHVILLQVAASYYKLPGDHIDPGQAHATGLSRCLNYRLGEADHATPDQTINHENWEVGELLARWWRPNFETFMYPYMPPHITRPKEIKSIYAVQLPAYRAFVVPSNMKLVAVPLFELYDNAVRYGPSLSTIPHLISKYELEMA